MEQNNAYKKGFIPYASAAFLIGIVGGFSTVLGPAFVQDIGIDYNNTTWTALAQAMSTAACAPILGKLGDVIGRRTTLLLGISVYGFGNTLSALANSLLFMLIARFIVGVGSAAIMPVVLAYIVTEFPPNEVAKGFSLYMLISSASVVFGPTLGGLMIEAYGWRTMIWACVIITTVVFFLCLMTHGKADSIRSPLTDFDGIGAVLVLIFFSLVLCIPSFGQNFGWTSLAFLWVLIATILSLTGLILTEKRAKNPILPGSYMKRKAFILSIFCSIPYTGADAGQHDQSHRVCELHSAGQFRHLRLCDLYHVSGYVPWRGRSGAAGRPVGTQMGIDGIPDFDRNRLRTYAVFLQQHLRHFAGTLSWHTRLWSGWKRHDFYESSSLRRPRRTSRSGHRNLWSVS